MAVLAMGMMATGGVLSAFGQADAAAQQAANQIAQFNQNEINRHKEWSNQSWFQILNEAQKWATNKAIAKDALSTREKNLFWERVRLDNSNAKMSKAMFKGYRDLESTLSGRMPKTSGTARAILRSSMNSYHEARNTVNVNMALKERAYEDQYQKALAMRDFGFSPIQEFNANKYIGADPSSAYKSALTQGLTQTATGMASAHMGFMGSGGSYTSSNNLIPWGGSS
tara:strand:- start:103 stop:780 length:678 start_codon:yes stop_codon:yes gene_type:complete